MMTTRGAAPCDCDICTRCGEIIIWGCAVEGFTHQAPNSITDYVNCR